MLLAHHSGYKNKPKTFPENFLPQNLPCRINILSSLYFPKEKVIELEEVKASLVSTERAGILLIMGGQDATPSPVQACP
jgi:hypothetical protein|uniref:hypothetical protein n=1 Tax=Prevotella sp. TaxID=59823 RepID=UPI0025FA051E|nr:hypothetical protein [Prevotella sp.]